MTTARRDIPTPLRLAILLVALALFLISVDMIGRGAKTLNKDRVQASEEHAFNWDNPLVGLALGVLATVLVQSSSVTTTTIVTMVGAGTFPIETAVPMIIGANIGTTVTNTIVSIGHVSRAQEFRQAFAAATVHDFFNLCSTIVLLPLEIGTRCISRAARALVEWMDLDPSSAVEFNSPIKMLVGNTSKAMLAFLQDGLGMSSAAASYTLIGLAVVLIFVCLTAITRNMRKLIAQRVEVAMNSVLAKSGLLGIVIGLFVTVAVQSSSITTSILVPMCGAGILSLRNAYPIMLGANLGTTTTALLGSIVTGPTGLTIALVHCLFNLMGVAIFYPIPFLRDVPVRLATALAEVATRFKLWVLAYMLMTFLLLPLMILVLFG